ncbi:hypothetical protein GCM10007362_07730 [Saccharibacillus endophyticus]|uniref:Uncharacterized protein n=1 Tax=Saccharibacillus endophyticus TaxID=2060666 RepID=A0ABQ1ZPN6_9BACL|nr:hypothetical protein GCM10007362_07730 [Saccharibacillus endophyticus]
MRITHDTLGESVGLNDAPPATYRVEFKMSNAGEEFFTTEKPQPEEKFAGSSFPIRIR